jgi:hypothetical protein
MTSDAANLSFLNNRAVHLLRNGQYAQCLSTLRQALNKIAVKESQEDSRYPHVKNTLAKPLESGLLQAVPIASSAQVLVDGPETICTGSYLSLYGCVFTFSADVDALEHPAIAATFLYNMGAALHFHGLFSGRASNLKKAEKFYKTVFQLFASLDWPAASTSQPHDDVSLLKAALYYNSAHISSYFHVKNETVWYVQQTCLILRSSTTYQSPTVQKHLQCINTSISTAAILMRTLMNCAPAA